MAGPFPGMDPYIECQGSWPDFHSRLIAEACNALSVQLPDDYVPRVDERIELVDFVRPGETSYRPDVLVARRVTPARQPGRKGSRCARSNRCLSMSAITTWRKFATRGWRFAACRPWN